MSSQHCGFSGFCGAWTVQTQSLGNSQMLAALQGMKHRLIVELSCGNPQKQHHFASAFSASPCRILGPKHLVCFSRPYVWSPPRSPEVLELQVHGCQANAHPKGSMVAVL